MLLVISFTPRSQEITAPNGKIKLVLHKPSAEVREFQFSAFYKQSNRFIEVLKPSKLGPVLADAHFTTDLKLIKESKPISIHDTCQMVTGKQRLCENVGTEKIGHAGFNEGKTKYTEKDIRFTQNKNVVYATVMGIPTGEMKIKALGSAKIKSIKMPGGKEVIKWKQSNGVLSIQKAGNLPNKIAVVFKIIQ